MVNMTTLDYKADVICKTVELILKHYILFVIRQSFIHFIFITIVYAPSEIMG